MKNSFVRLVLTMLVGLAGSAGHAQPLPIPPNILAANNLPMVMLSASKDFTMFWKAYTDFDDIDADGVIDRTFMPAYKYYGYFDPTKCYSYSAANTRFEPKRISDANGYCTAGASEWSGNFLNWTSMSRIDVLRKVLYGGMRSLDTATDTTLEMSFVPRNSQAFVKYYNGTDLDRLTPFNSDAAKAKGLTFCRRPVENSGVSHTGTFTPEIRVAVGNLILWNMTEVRTCNWSTEVGYTWRSATIDYLSANYETPAGTRGATTPAHVHLTSVPSRTGENTSFVARIQACVSSLLGNEKCKDYNPTGTAKYKPIGLLQEFGVSEKTGVEPARAEFGLMMGSYDNNLQGGVLRKNMGQINDEIDPLTGVFLTPASGGIIRSFNEITLYGYDVASGNYSQTCQSDTITNGSCPSWGNPVSELLLESLRFFAGKSAAYSAGAKDVAVGLPAVTTRKDPITDNPVIGASTRTKLYGQGVCRPLNMLTVTSGASSFDDDSLSLFSDIGAAHASAAEITKLLGDKEGITGTKRMIGETSADTNKLCTGKTIDDLGQVKGVCADGPNFRGTYLGAGMAYYANTNKIRNDITPLPAQLPTNALKVRNYGVSMSGGVATIEVPTQNGMKAYITPAALDSQSGRPLAGNMVDFKILSRATDGKSGSALVLWQHSMLGEDQDQDMLGALRYVVDDTKTPWQINVYTRAVESDTGSTQPYAFGYTLVGTANLDATTSDGVHLHSGINKAASIEAAGSVSLSPGAVMGTSATDNSVCIASTGSNGTLCSVVDGKTTKGETYKTYKLVGGTDTLIKEPLWFMSKYGGFKHDAANPYPTAANASLWDVKRNDGKPCGGANPLPCSDGEPDNYFVARSPELLESGLREILEDIVNSSNTAPAVAASQLRAGDLKYVASFDSGDGRGELSAYEVDAATGDFKTDAKWKAHEELGKAAGLIRPVITNNGSTGVAFEWASIGNTKQDILKNGAAAAVAVAYGQSMMAWLRGGSDTKFRTRAATSVMGAIINSNPTVEVAPVANFFGAAFAGYDAFANTWAKRNPIVWVGAGDGMLHGFDASTGANGGKPIMSYIPEPVFARLPDWASPSKPKVQSFVDGSPFVGDVKVAGNWATYLFSPLGRGGKGVFALDVTKAGTSDTPAIPHELTQANAANIFKWQFNSTDDTVGTDDLGYIVSEPMNNRATGQTGQIAMMNNGQFAAILGNGVASASGKAALYILFADGPAAGSWTGRYVKLVADNVGVGNGLSQPIWVDSNGDGKADIIYAGDLKGNLWKFDVSSANTANWKVAYQGKPLFIAKDGAGNLLPITSSPEFRSHPLGGLVINFATGKAILPADFPNSSRTHGIFGIWDKVAFAGMTAAELDANLPWTLGKVLEPRTFVGGTGLKRGLTGGVIDWSTRVGWHLPFNVASEMSVSNPTVAVNELFIVSVSPPLPPAPGQPDPCFQSPQARLTVINSVTGLPSGILGKTIITLPDGSTVEVYAASIGTNEQKLRFTRDSVTPGCTDGAFACIVSVEGGVLPASFRGRPPTPPSRLYWREIPGLKTR